MGRDRVYLKNDSDEALYLEPGESVPAILMFDPQVGAENVVHYSPREEDEDRVPGVLVALDVGADVEAVVEDLNEREDVLAASRILSGLRSGERAEDED